MSLRGPSDNPYENEAEGRVWMVGGPTFCFFKSLDNNMVYSLGIDVYVYI